MPGKMDASIIESCYLSKSLVKVGVKEDGAFANRKEYVIVNIISCSRGIKATLIFHNFKRLVLNLFLTN